MTIIHDNFCGYAEFSNDDFVFSVSGHTVKLLPASSDPIRISKCISDLYNYKVQSPEYIFGVDDTEYRIAFLLQNNFKLNIGTWRSSSFGAPIIIKSAGNADGFYNSLSDEWNKFNAISFSGGIIDAVYNPKVAALKSEPWTKEREEKLRDANGARSIEIKPFDDYTHAVNVIIDGIKATFRYSVSQGSGADDRSTTSLGSLISFIRLEFEEAQEFCSISRFYNVIRSLLAIFSQQNNVNFEVSVHQRNKESKYIQTAVCKINDGFTDYCKRHFHNVVPLHAFQTHLAKLIEIICSGEADALLALLPNSNKRLNTISMTNVQDLCTALEVEYDLCGNKRPKDELIEKLKAAIKYAIKSFSDETPDIDVDKQTTISSAFQYLDFTLKHKILHLYLEHKEAVDGVIKKWSCPEITIDSLGAFVKLRNGKTHSGKIDWGQSADLYAPLLVLAYVCLLNRSGVPEKEIASAVLQLF